MKKWKYLLLAGVLFGALLLLSGCFLKADSLYSLPRRTDAYENLQKAAEKAMGDDGEYAAPMYGANRQAVQQADLNGDGNDEYIVFARCSGEKPLKVFVFAQEKKDFSLLYTLEGEGTAFDSVEYADMNRSGGYELIVGRRVSDRVTCSLSVYAFRNGEGVKELASVNYSDYLLSDMDADGRDDLFVIRSVTGRKKAVANLYRWTKNELSSGLSISLSAPVDNIMRVCPGLLSDGSPAVFVASTYDENRILTDVFAVSDSNLRNISATGSDGSSTQTLRSYYIYSDDIDGDGVIEIPETVYLSEDSEDEYIIIWNEMNPDGTRTEKLRTYHNYSDGWYLALPEKWSENLIVTRRFSGKAASYVFRTEDEDGTLHTILTLYKFTGDDTARAESLGRFLLEKTDTACYSALIGDSDLSSGCSEDDIREMFRLIASDSNQSEN